MLGVANPKSPFHRLRRRERAAPVCVDVEPGWSWFPVMPSRRAGPGVVFPVCPGVEVRCLDVLLIGADVGGQVRRVRALNCRAAVGRHKFCTALVTSSRVALLPPSNLREVSTRRR